MSYLKCNYCGLEKAEMSNIGISVHFAACTNKMFAEFKALKEKAEPPSQQYLPKGFWDVSEFFSPVYGRKSCIRIHLGNGAWRVLSIINSEHKQDQSVCDIHNVDMGFFTQEQLDADRLPPCKEESRPRSKSESQREAWEVYKRNDGELQAEFKREVESDIKALTSKLDAVLEEDNWSRVPRSVEMRVLRSYHELFQEMCLHTSQTTDGKNSYCSACGKGLTPEESRKGLEACDDPAHSVPCRTDHLIRGPVGSSRGTTPIPRGDPKWGEDKP